jgi:RNA polymerase sigma-70 factor, ECF subfamily
MTAATSCQDCAGIEATWRESYTSLAGWCLWATHDADAAQDIALEAFTRLCTRWREVRDPRGFLFVTATNLVRDHWRGQRRDERLLTRLAGGTPDSHREPDPDLRLFVEGLPPTQRQAVLCYYFADLSVADTARVLGMPQGSVKRALFEARGRLRAGLAMAG